MAKRSIRPPRAKNSKNIRTQQLSSGSTNELLPVFSFAWYQDNADCCKKLTVSHYGKALEKILKLSKMRWQDIQTNSRQRNGTEVISRNEIKATIPREITEDVDFLSIRFHDDKGRIVGFRDGVVFHVVWFDVNPFILYKH